MLLELELQSLLVMMKTQHKSQAQGLVLEVGEGHLGHLVVLMKVVKVKFLQEEEVGAEVPVA